MAEPRRVLYFAENALSAIQGGGIVAYAVLKGLPADRLLGFFEYRNITPVPEYADRFVYLGHAWRTPSVLRAINRVTRGWTTAVLRRLFPDHHIRRDLAFVQQQVETVGFQPDVVYFAGLSYRYLRLAVMAAEHFDLPMVQLNMDDWMQVEREAAGWLGRVWHRRIVRALTEASARSFVSTSNSPRLAAKLSTLTGFRHVAANNCCSDLMAHATQPTSSRPNWIPVITYAGAMNEHLQGESLKVLASAVTELNAEGTPVHLHIYTPWEFAPAANAVAVPHAVFYKGQVGRERLADIFRRSDFLATTVTYRDRHISLFRHSLSTKLSEYLCAGKPVISMGHHDWHLHEYVQDHACGFSIAMSEQFSRAAIKAQLRRILATDPSVLAEIGRRNRALWERAHDVTVMARDTRHALRLEARGESGTYAPRGVVWLGGPTDRGTEDWVPAPKLKAICRRLFDVFEHRAVDLVGPRAFSHPALSDVAAYCEDIGLRVTVVDAEQADANGGRYEPAGAHWSLAASQRRPSAAMTTALDVFAQVAELRGTGLRPSTPATRAIAALSVRVSEFSGRKPIVWSYGSTAVGHEVLSAIAAHPWLSRTVRIGGFLSSPGHCGSDILHGRTWRSVDRLIPGDADFVLVASETSRLAIQEELSRRGLLGRAVLLYGSSTAGLNYERMPQGPGQTFVEGLTARDYATQELRARRSTTVAPHITDIAPATSIRRAR